MTNNLHLFHLSDLHFGYEDKAALEWAREEIASRKPDLVVVSGDLTMRARHHEFTAAKAWFAKLEAPVIVAPGNHDLPAYYLPERYLTPLKRFYAFKRAVEKPATLPGFAIVSLNTNVAAQPRLNWSKGWVSEGALEKCLAQIDALPSETRVLVTAHHPLREAGTRGTALTKNGAKALEALAVRNVIGVLSGHVHDGFDIEETTENGSVRMIGCGTLSQRLRKTPPSFNELIWDGERLEVKLQDQGFAFDEEKSTYS